MWNGAPNGIPYIVVSGSQPTVPLNWTAYGDESDPGPYPVPPDAPIEGGPNSDGDRHVLVIDRDNWKLYELGYAFPINNGASWNANCGAIFDLNSNALRPAGWTSADAAGLPIFPGLVRYDEVFEQQEIKHAIRFTAQITSSCLCCSRTSLGQFKYECESSSDGNESSFESFIRYFQLYSGDAGDPTSDEEVWNDSRGQWLQLVFQWRSRYALERRRAECVEDIEGIEF